MCTILSSCITTNEPIDISPKANIYRQNDIISMCRLKKVDKVEESTDIICVYDHPQSKVDDRVYIGYGNQCPKRIYCDKM